MNGERSCVQTTEVSLATATVQRCVTVQNLFPKALPGHTDAIVLPHYRREVAHKKELVVRILRNAEKAYDTPLGIRAIDPLETRGLKVAFVAVKAGRDRLY